MVKYTGVPTILMYTFWLYAILCWKYYMTKSRTMGSSVYVAAYLSTPQSIGSTSKYMYSLLLALSIKIIFLEAHLAINAQSWKCYYFLTQQSQSGESFQRSNLKNKKQQIYTHQDYFSNLKLQTTNISQTKVIWNELWQICYHHPHYHSFKY